MPSCDCYWTPLSQVMAWWRWKTSHYLGQCWPRPSKQDGVTWPQWVKARTSETGAGPKLRPRILTTSVFITWARASNLKYTAIFFWCHYAILSTVYRVYDANKSIHTNTSELGMSRWWPFVVPVSWCPVRPCHSGSFGDRTPVTCVHSRVADLRMSSGMTAWLGAGVAALWLADQSHTPLEWHLTTSKN